MSDSKPKYTKEILESKTKEELINLVLLLEEEKELLNFLIDEYENAQQSLGKAVESHLSDYLQNIVTTKTVGEA
tara:strand:- start:4396 stop:4617 length:222 start_codon:yes stop_codon:yes gene_type:complete